MTLLRSALLVLVLTSAACSSDPSHPATSVEIRQHITADLTPALAEARLGKPTAVEGSGLLIYRYDLEDKTTLPLSFPGYRPILYAKLVHPGGKIEDLPLR